MKSKLRISKLSGEGIIRTMSSHHVRVGGNTTDGNEVATPETAESFSRSEAAQVRLEIQVICCFFKIRGRKRSGLKQNFSSPGK